MMVSPSPLIIPVENQVRELDAKLLLACVAAERGVPVHANGNPRIDLLRADVRDYFAPEVRALQQRYGDFILVNTDFSLVNNFVPALNLIARDGEGQPQVSRTGRGMSVEFATGMAAHQQVIYDRFRELLPQLAGWFPHHRIVLRPHPSENHDVWRTVLADCPQIEVARQGNVVAWLMAAKVLLHNGCTTAVEASVLETPAVSYMPVRSDTYDYHLPNGLSHGASTPAAVREHLAAILAGQRGVVDAVVRERLFARHLAATHGALACDRVLGVLFASAHAVPVSQSGPGLRWLKAWLTANIRTLVKRFNGLRPQHRNSAAYHAHRFPGVSAPELNARIARFGAELGRFGGVRAEAYSSHVFRIHDLATTTRSARPEVTRVSAT